MCSPQTTLSLLAFAASVTLLSVSSHSVSLPSQVKSSPSAPALMADSALPASAVGSSTTSAAARGFVSLLFLPKKPIPLPLCARRADVNMSSSLLISLLTPYLSQELCGSWMGRMVPCILRMQGRMCDYYTTLCEQL